MYGFKMCAQARVAHRWLNWIGCVTLGLSTQIAFADAPAASVAAKPCAAVPSALPEPVRLAAAHKLQQTASVDGHAEAYLMAAFARYFVHVEQALDQLQRHEITSAQWLASQRKAHRRLQKAARTELSPNQTRKWLHSITLAPAFEHVPQQLDWPGTPQSWRQIYRSIGIHTDW